MDDESRTDRLSRELGALRQQVREFRLLVLRGLAWTAVALVVVGALLPLWSEDDRTFRVATTGVIGVREPGDGFGRAVGIGFLGLVAVLVLLLLVLLGSVVGAQGRASRDSLRGAVLTMSLVGTGVAGLFSLLAWGSDEVDTSAGPGALVVLAGVLLASFVLTHRPFRDLWVTDGRPPATGLIDRLD